MQNSENAPNSNYNLKVCYISQNPDGTENVQLMTADEFLKTNSALTHVRETDTYSNNTGKTDQ